MSAGVWALFLVAAAAGAVARAVVDGLVGASDFPWGTWVVNMSGAFVLGVLTGLGLHHGLGADPRLVLGTGFCGAYTTFSTFTYETLRLAETGATRAAARNVAISVAGGLTAAAIGLALTSF